jgi:enoyl-CoA hydratase/carnithine racemase
MSESNHEQTYADMVRERGPLDAFQVVRFEAVDRIATVTLNDPDHLNSYTIRMTGELREALRRAEDAADARVVILTGAGKAFSAGGDLAGDARFRFDAARAP